MAKSTGTSKRAEDSTGSTAPKDTKISKVDWWAPQVLAILCVVGYASATLGPMVSALVTGSGLRVDLPAQGDAQPVPGLGGSGVQVTTGPRELWRIEDPSAMQWVAALLPPLLTCLALVVGTWLLWRFLRVVGGGDPFHDPRARRLLLGGGVLVMLWAVCLPMVQLAADFMVLIEAGHNGLHVHVGGQELAGVGVGVVFGGVLICLAEIFRRGHHMSADLDGLV